MADEQFQIKIVSTADNTGFNSSAGAVSDLNKEMGVIHATNEDVEKATRKTSEAVEEGAEKFGEARREIREAGNELGRAAGLSHGGALALGGVSAAAVAAGAALEFLRSTYEAIQSEIEGPLNIEVPADAPAHISSAAAAWNAYADARAKVVNESKSPESQESAAEKKLAGELKMIKEVLAAEKEKALADLELHKAEMSPDEYAATRANINNIFEDQGTKEEEKNRRAQIAAKADEAGNLEADAAQKTKQAEAIHVAPEKVQKFEQKTLDENASNSEKAMEETKARLAMLDRIEKSNKDPGSVPEYEGVGGEVQKLSERYQFHRAYGYGGTIKEARDRENARLAQEQGDIDRAENYGPGEEERRKKKTELMSQAGAESGKAEVLRGEVKTDTTAESAQNQVDSQVAQLHQASARQVIGASAQTAAAVQQFTAATVGGFSDVHATFLNHQSQLDGLRRQITELARGGHN